MWRLRHSRKEVLHVSPQLVERWRGAGRVHVEDGGKRRLVSRRAVGAVCRHASAKPLFRAFYRLGRRWRRRRLVDSAQACYRTRRGQKPRLVLPFREDYSYALIPPCSFGTTQHFVREFLRTVIVRVKQDQNATFSPTYSPSSQLDRSLQLAFFQYLVALNTDRSQRIHLDIRRHLRGDSTQQDGNRFYFAPALNDGRDRHHRSQLSAANRSSASASGSSNPAMPS